MKITGPVYVGTCSPENSTDGCQMTNYLATAGGFTFDWTGIITPGQDFYVKQAAAKWPWSRAPKTGPVGSDKDFQNPANHRSKDFATACKVQYQAAAAIGSLASGQIVETISDTNATDTNTADKTATLDTGGSSSGSGGSSSGGSSSSGSGESSSGGSRSGGSSPGGSSSSSGRGGRHSAR
ncbi:MAG: hypothetical protein ABSG43_28175 [Solirubrobacteraceae bacterium]